MSVKSNDSISIFLAGDSTVSNYPNTQAPMAGWGQVISKYFNEKVTIKNFAIAGRSSKSFIDQGVLDKILNEIKPNDYFLIQFGHNDEKKDDPSRYTDPNTSFKSYLKKYIDGARKLNAIPILLTPVSRRLFDENNKIQDAHGEYPNSMKELAQAEDVPLIDLTKISKTYFEKLGPDATKKIFLYLEPGKNPNYPNGSTDNTHFHENGADKIASLIINEIKKSNIPLKNYIK